MTPDSATSPSSPWQPLVTGELAATVLDTVKALASGLRTAIPTPRAGLDTQEETLWHASLAAGDAGRALFFAYLDFHSQATRAEDAGDDGEPPPDDDDVRALELLDRASDRAATGPRRVGLLTGLPGIAWVGEHLRNRLFAQEASAGNEVDDIVLAWLSGDAWDDGFDAQGNLVGLGTYALERMPLPAAARALELVVERLAASAESSTAGAAWLTRPERLSPARRLRHPQGSYDLGAAHGAAGAIALLGAICHAGIASGRARALLDEAVRWLLAHQSRDCEEGRFPHVVAPGVETRGSRLAWCYGDLGIAAALSVAGLGAIRPDWQRAAVEIARAAAGRPPAACGVVDAGLCHGAAGVAHLFHRLYQASGEPSLGDAARRWLGQALAWRQPEGGAAGFRTWEADAEGRGAWYDDYGFLTGAAGIGLALLAAVSPVEPAWDRALRISLRH